MSISWGKTAVLVGGVYLVPKVLSYLTTRPENTASTLGKIRGNLAGLREELKDIAGEDVWFVVSKMIGENGWIGMLGLLSVCSHQQPKSITWISKDTLPPTFMDRILSLLEKAEKNVSYAGVFAVFSASAFVGRNLFVLACPSLAGVL